MSAAGQKDLENTVFEVAGDAREIARWGGR
jgi:hypothetical protein